MAHPIRQLIQPGIDVVRRLWLPFVLVQLLGLALVVAYFQSSTVAGWCDAAGRVKQRFGLPFAAVAMSIASGIVPEIFKTITGVDRTFDRRRLSILLHNSGLFAIAGVTVDLLYSGLGNWLGESREWSTVATKVLIDQLGYTPFFAVPLISFSYTLRSNNYQIGKTLRAIDRGWYGREVLPVLIVCWAYWVPMVTLAYVLPVKLTLLYGLVASAASAILLTAIAGRERPAPTAAASVP